MKISVDDLAAADIRVLDTRSAEAFCNGHIPGSISIPEGPEFDEWFQLMAIDDQPTALLVDSGREIELGRKAKKKLGANYKGAVNGGFEAWQQSGREIDVLVSILPDEFRMDYKFEEQMCLLDLREAEAFLDHRVEGALSYPAGDVREVFPSVDIDDNIYLYGDNAAQASLVGSVLKGLGLISLRIVLANYADIRKEDLDFTGESLKKKKKAPKGE